MWCLLLRQLFAIVAHSANIGQTSDGGRQEPRKGLGGVTGKSGVHYVHLVASYCHKIELKCMVLWSIKSYGGHKPLKP